MTYNDHHYQSALNFLHGVGPIKARDLIYKLDSLELLFTLTPTKLASLTGYSASFFKRMNRNEALNASVPIVSYHSKKGVRTHFITDKSYPNRLRQCDDAPVALYSLGEADFNDGRFVAIVGTRESTQYGRRLCEELVSILAENSITVVSGLAYGIDAWAHYYSLIYKTPTVGVLGHGLDRIYPSGNRSLAGKMIKQGAVLSEFPPGTNPDKENFPKRNRIVAGMCDATIVIESKETGGSLITAELANDYNRDVFAFPGSIYQSTSLGCNRLIRDDQAHLLIRPGDFLEKMGWGQSAPVTERQRKLFSSLSPIQQELVSHIQQDPMIHVDHLALRARMPVSKLNSELFYLELEGLVKCLPGKRYCLP